MARRSASVALLCAALFVLAALADADRVNGPLRPRSRDEGTRITQTQLNKQVGVNGAFSRDTEFNFNNRQEQRIDRRLLDARTRPAVGVTRPGRGDDGTRITQTQLNKQIGVNGAFNRDTEFNFNNRQEQRIDRRLLDARSRPAVGVNRPGRGDEGTRITQTQLNKQIGINGAFNRDTEFNFNNRQEQRIDRRLLDARIRPAVGVTRHGRGDDSTRITQTQVNKQIGVNGAFNRDTEFNFNNRQEQRIDRRLLDARIRPAVGVTRHGRGDDGIRITQTQVSKQIGINGAFNRDTESNFNSNQDQRIGRHLLDVEA
ncbi:hypothetical protein MNEG_8120 [Monoraphidium neglectum]|uniref:Uncharacterized protein n=1 Tax=Monoraphidium neglectum TaxID=145388 RepID=A0A0D2MGH5_9CHLO|nr:hypothetical protein MNEG_8120 [Monoraphidium neglectum]KIY99841.1 hypothetical protein MNEG_8120 [Monoraphidium neglectum]|eukprot:XP_013898861.1 hypothetical protein MNEG_8120 [Monoraphidium neglectum]